VLDVVNLAEEKEKNTLRGLMLSPTSTLEILAGKGLLTFLMTIVVIALSIYFIGYKPGKHRDYCNCYYFVILILYRAGTLLGLYSKSVMEASVLVLPVIVVFSFGTFIVAWTDQYPILKIVNYLPNIQLLEIAKKVEEKLGFADMLVHLGIIFAWVFAISVITVAIYRKRRLD